MIKHDMDFGQVHVMEFSWHFLKKMMGFPSDLVSFLTQLPKRHEKIPVMFFTGFIKKTDRIKMNMMIIYFLILM